MDFKQISKALGCEHQWIDETQYVWGVDFLESHGSTGWGFQEGEKNPRWSGGKQAYEDRRNAKRRTPEGRVKGTKRMTEWREKNREHYNSYMRDWRKTNADKSNANAKAYRERQKAA